MEDRMNDEERERVQTETEAEKMTRGNVKDITQRKNRGEMKEGEKLQTITQLVRRKIYKGKNNESSPKNASFTQNNMFLRNCWCSTGKRRPYDFGTTQGK